ncbi:hypothetical protein SAMN04487983_1024109 [Streptomyces sp. yr375]|uniref:hypothetical protein n=1 Tax=Streptomyces sp. yr375 TaxID=1761906 RepID=UPI0008CB6B87|nr:hypothetical protein [Streptomyces sp. yr375]SER89904.1 hypothetical protein SAMN04487983_1024109 [Streptomyces sp. yr375]
MSSPCDPKYAPAGEVGAALLMIDSRLKAIYDDNTEPDEPDLEQQEMVEQFAASMGPDGIDAMLDGTCTLIYMFMKWLRMTCEDHGKDVIEYVVPTHVATMRMMPRTFSPEVIPIMTGLIVAAGTGLSPSLWRAQYGPWTDAEMNPLEATAVLLAERINRIADDTDYATRLITEALSRTERKRR